MYLFEKIFKKAKRILDIYNRWFFKSKKHNQEILQYPATSHEHESLLFMAKSNKLEKLDDAHQKAFSLLATVGKFFQVILYFLLFKNTLFHFELYIG